MPDDSLNNGRRTLGVIDGTLTQLSLGIIGLIPTLAAVLIRPHLLRAQIAGVQERGRTGILLAPGPFFVIGVFVGLISFSLLASLSQGALINMGENAAAAVGAGQFWQVASIAAPLFLAALVLGLLFAVTGVLWRLPERSLISAIRAAQYGLFGVLAVLVAAEPLSNLVGDGGENSVFEPAVYASVGLWTAFFHDRMLAGRQAAIWMRAGAAISIAPGAAALIAISYL